MNLRNVIERIRDSQFLVPTAGIVFSVGLVAVAHNLDRSSYAPSLLIGSSPDSARTLLATIAGSIITVAALVFSFTAVTVQMAATQYSPRIVQQVLRDRFQQWTVALVMGTFTFALVSLATVDAPGQSTNSPNWTVTIGVLLGVASAVSIVGFIDHVTRHVRIDDTIRRISMRVRDGLAAADDVPLEDDEPWQLPESADSTCLRSAETGFVQEIDIRDLVEDLPAGSLARLDVWTGQFVAEGSRILTAWSDEPMPDHIRSRIAIGETRTVEQDPGLGIRQLVDVALRALSPGINDPATAADVVRHLAVGLRAAHLAPAPTRSFAAANGARLFTPHAPTTADYVADSLGQIRQAALDQPVVLRAMVEAIDALADELVDEGRDHSALRHEGEAAAGRLEELLQAMTRVERPPGLSSDPTG